MSKPTPPGYRTTNWRTYNAALKQRGSLHIWFDPVTVWLAEPSGKRGRLATFTDAAIRACLTLKALFGLPLRQTTGLVASLLKRAGSQSDIELRSPDSTSQCPGSGPVLSSSLTFALAFSSGSRWLPLFG